MLTHAEIMRLSFTRTPTHITAVTPVLTQPQLVGVRTGINSTYEELILAAPLLYHALDTVKELIAAWLAILEDNGIDVLTPHMLNVITAIALIEKAAQEGTVETASKLNPKS